LAAGFVLRECSPVRIPSKMRLEQTALDRLGEVRFLDKKFIP
jgi:hypothetical protein